MTVLLAVACTDPTTGDRPDTVPDVVALGTADLSVEGPRFDPVVYGDVTILDQEDLDRLAPYAVVEGDLVLEATALRTVDLPLLREVGGELRIWENDQLSSLSLPSLEAVGGDLSLYDDPQLGELTGLGALVDVGGSLVLNRLPGLVDLGGLERLQSVGRLYLFHDLGLRSLDGLDALEVVDGPVQVWEAYGLRDLRLPALRQVTGKLDLFDARALTTMELPVLSALGGLELHHCDALTDLRGAFPLVRTLPGDLVVQYDPALASLDGLEGLTSVGAVRLEQLDALADTDGLSGLTLVRGQLAVERADALPRLGFDAVQQAGTVVVRLNAALADPALLALEATGELRFEGNRSLPDCAVEALAARVDTLRVTCAGNLDAGCATLCAP